MSYWGYYIPAKAWLGKQPSKDDESSKYLTDENFDISQLSDIVHEKELTSGISVRSYCDGLILFDFQNAPDFVNESAAEDLSSFEKSALLRLERTDVLNAHVVCLRQSLSLLQNWGLPFQSITPHDLLQHSTDDDGRIGVGFKSDRDADLHMARYASSYNSQVPKTFDRRIQGRFLIIENETLEDSFLRLDDLLSNKPSKVHRLVALYDFTTVSLQDHDYPRSLISAWTIIEKLIDEMWISFIDANRKKTINSNEITFINKDRAKKLTGRDYTASVRTEILSILDIIPFNTYQDIEKIRRVRTKWMHELNDVTMVDAQLARDIVSDLFKSVYNFGLPKGIDMTL
ncbi:MAG: hypothetical protein H8D23_21855 [Candidatus Brocadiales bacterium]|nr:hypothetical protein [Candidatus Brocadiales bacterium]